MLGVALKVPAIVVTMVALMFAAGCGSSDAPATAPATSELAGTITAAGSTSVQPVSELLAEAFMENHRQTTINVQGGGSSAGIKAVEQGVAEIGASSRELKTEEKGLYEFVIGLDGIAVIVHSANGIDNLTLAQIKDIYAGRTTNWKDVGGLNAAIVVVTREEGSGTRGAFEEIVMGKDRISDRSIVQNSTGSVRTAVAGDNNAIGYVSLAALTEDVKAVKVDGVSPCRETIVSRSYKVARPFLYVTTSEPSGLTKAFIDFVLSPEAQPVIEKAGLVSIR